MTSNSTEEYDRGGKFGHYKQLPSVVAVLFVSHRRPQVTVIERAVDGWRQREYPAGEEVALETPRLSFSVEELYGGIELDEGS